MAEKKSKKPPSSEEILKRQFRLIQKRIEKNQKDVQAACSHMRGCLSEFFGEVSWHTAGTAIVWHELVVGNPPVGICTACQRRFIPEDKDYAEWLAKPSGNRLSRAGVPLPYDGQQADYNPLREDFSQAFEPEPKRVTDLDDLTDEQIEQLFEKIRKTRKSTR